MKLQILIPQYKETEKVIKPLLDSIAFQMNIDFNDIGVIIVNDGTNTILSKKFLDSYPFNIRYIRAKHGGVSAARNVALDNATADYIMFCDADDTFFSSIAISIILESIERTDFYAFQSIFLEEVIVNNKHYYVKKDAHVFVHGKIYKLQYLKDINLRWEENLIYHEDGYFNAIALMCCPQNKYIKCSEPFYLWRYNATSVCRSDPYFVIKTYDQDIKAQELIIDRIKNINTPAARDLLLTQLYQTYFIDTGKNRSVEGLENYFKTLEIMTYDLFIKFKDLYLQTTEQQRLDKYNLTLEVAKKSNYYEEKPDYTLDKWLDDLSKIKEPI